MPDGQPQGVQWRSELVLVQLLEQLDAALDPVLLLLGHLASLHALKPLGLCRPLLVGTALVLLHILLLLVIATFQRLDIALVSWLPVSLDLQDLHAEDEDIATLDLRASSTVAIAKLRGDVHLPLVAL